MSLTWDPTEDHTVFDGRETVTITQKGARTIADDGSATWAEVTENVSALKRLVSNRQITNSGGKLKVGDTMWEVPYLVNVTPKIGDTLTEGSSVWVIVWVDNKPILEMWRVYARK